MLELNEREMKIVANKFDVNMETLKREIEKDNVRMFPSYETFFYWLHDDLKPTQYIKMLFEKSNLLKESKYIVLGSGITVYKY
ncbi:anthranilate synthase [Bacillus cereus]|uniref:Anthranilate synthase n=1 Tax=Bacillus cereus TaxID=1396 RepID=A0A9X0MLS0_BACCE|nr:MULTISPECIES: hypothetical protein [Bacillus cereus group]KXY50996.1 anthranilate synthase [Bacillus cereus]MDX5808632.1 hypothetical protein [Bacillus cereus group sp. BfR-BA-02730]